MARASPSALISFSADSGNRSNPRRRSFSFESRTIGIVLGLLVGAAILSMIAAPGAFRSSGPPEPLGSASLHAYEVNRDSQSKVEVDGSKRIVKKKK